MGRRIRIPALLDLLIVSDAEEILACATDPALLRGPLPHAPPLNRAIPVSYTHLTLPTICSV